MKLPARCAAGHTWDPGTTAEARDQVGSRGPVRHQRKVATVSGIEVEDDAAICAGHGQLVAGQRVGDGCSELGQVDRLRVTDEVRDRHAECAAGVCRFQRIKAARTEQSILEVGQAQAVIADERSSSPSSRQRSESCLGPENC